MFSKRWIGGLMALLVLLGSTVQGSSEAQAEEINYSDRAYTISVADTTATEKQDLLLALVAEAGPSPEYQNSLLGGIDRAIGDPARWDSYGGLINAAYNAAAELFFDGNRYDGSLTDAAWKDVPGLYTWEIQVLTQDAALIRVDQRLFIWKRPGTPDYLKSDYDFGYARNYYSGLSRVEPPRTSLLFSGVTTPLPEEVPPGTVLTLPTIWSVEPAREVKAWWVCYGTPAFREIFADAYTTTEADLGCRVIGQSAGSLAGYQPAGTWIETVVANTTPPPPVTKITGSTPVISDTTPVVDQVLSANPGIWTPADVTLRYQWYRKSPSGSVRAITGATSADFTVRAKDHRYRLKVKVIGTKTGLTSVAKTSAWTSRVVKAKFADTPVSTITFEGATPRVGKVLSAVPGAFTPAATYHRYQWYRNGRAIYRATKATFKLGSKDLGKTVSVRVRSYRAGYVTVSQYTVPVGPIQPGLVSARPRVSDTTPTVDQTLTANVGTWAPEGVAFTYQWYRKSPSGSVREITGATEASYTVSGQYAGYKFRVKVTGSLTDFVSVSRNSYWTYSASKARFTDTPVPVVTGSTVVDQNLTADAGVWTPSPGTMSFQWYKVSPGGKTYTIYGATGANYLVQPGDVNYRLKVKVTSRKTGYVTASRTSVLTLPVTLV